MIKNFFLDMLCQSISKQIFCVGFPESMDLRILKAAYFLLEKKIVKYIYFFSEKNSTIRFAKDHNIFLDQYLDQIHWVVEKETHPLSKANHLLKDKKLDVVIAGCCYPTAQVIRSGLKVLGLAKNSKHLSGAFLMYRNFDIPEIFLLADCAVTVEPNATQLAMIAQESVETWKRITSTNSFFKKDPCVAFLSFSTMESAKNAKVELVRESLSIFQKACPTIMSDGELQFDVAVDKIVRKKKYPKCAFGNTNVPNILIFPDLNSGNIGYKIAQKWGGFKAFGPLLQGLSRPLGDLSRGASVEEIIITTCIHLLQVDGSSKY